MDALAGEDVRLDDVDQPAQQNGAVADIVGKRRHADAHAFGGIGFALAFERLLPVAIQTPCPARNRDHALSSRNAAISKLADRPPATRMVTPRSSMTRHVGRIVVDLGRIRMNGHGRKAGRLRKLATQFAQPMVDRRRRDVDIARNNGNRRGRHNGCLHKAKFRSSLQWRRRSTPDSTVIWAIATSRATVQATMLAPWLTSQLTPSSAKCPSPDADTDAP